MKALTFTCIVAVGVLVFGTATNFFSSQLHQATVTQCEKQLWPADQHDAHVAFCNAYLSDAK